MSRTKYKKLSKERDDFLCFDKAIITVKEARKILGKKYDNSISDTDLMRIIGLMSKVANSVLETMSVPK